MDYTFSKILTASSSFMNFLDTVHNLLISSPINYEIVTIKCNDDHDTLCR